MLWLLLTGAFAGDTLKVAHDGWQVTAPDGWRHAEQGGGYALGSDTEAGLIVVFYTPGLTWEQMQASAAQGVREQGLVLSPSAPATPFDATAGKGLAVELSGMAADGTTVYGRAIGVLGARGGVAVLGLTTPEHAAVMSKRVEQVASSTVFFEPEKPKSDDLAVLQGPICSWSGSSGGGSGYSASAKMTFDGKGAVAWGSEFVASGSFGAGDNTGSWGAYSGNQNQPTDVGTYVVQGDRVTVRWPDGGTKTCAVHMRQTNGRITELQCDDGKLWGAGLCE